MGEPQRNAPCPCGSGIKYKRCCRKWRDPLDEVEVRPGTRVQFVTDWYEIRDLEELVELLGRQPDVSGDLERGWSRATPPGMGDAPEAELAIIDDGRLEVRADTHLVSEATRWWLYRIARELVVYQIGEVRCVEIGAA